MKILNYWGTCGSDLASTLHLSGTAEGELTTYAIKIFTPQGDVFKDLSINLPKNGSLSLELENILAEILPESGLRHALFSVTMDDTSSAVLRLQSKLSTCLSGALRVVSTAEPAFFPKLFSKSISSYLILANTSSEPIEVIARLISPNRAPENIYKLSPFATKLLSVETEFDEIRELSRKQRIATYIRARCKAENALAVCMFEQHIFDNGCTYMMVN